ncbi:DUF2798 domain-containing protein [Siphonobacter aquaeclarae]|jgi:hypothetical protein|uniref:DUF2798 domain-containing protein n=1 Tax=Siphonobacter aquaeclarae TaxID=563176 RepID=A0A1G9NEB1_9BACT|nr:DUF2798 domain-containing protein [Siphonobacter aquaeclarae]MBO9639911.1 DUF2798 domain-containing protein [Siphonobacter aquaeclarae]SDL84734.1 Protein of unknown function [Siphonobacter aquaeclarae]
MKRKYYKFVNTLFVVVPMTLVMAFVALLRNHGLTPGWVSLFFKAWSVMLPVAYLAAFLIIPRAKKLTDRFNWKE